MIELVEAVDFVKIQAKSIVEFGEEHQPMLFVLGSEHIDIVALVGLDKNLYKQYVTRLLQQLCAYAYIFIDEAWSVKLSDDSPLIPRLFSGEISASSLPLDDKEEILSVIAVENGKSCCSWSACIRYGTDDKRYLGKWERIEGITGRLVLKEW